MKAIISNEANQQRQVKKQAREQELASHIYIGDPESKIKQVLGTPDRINRHVSKYGEKKQYVYHRGSKMTCIYTEDGTVTDFQD